MSKEEAIEMLLEVKENVNTCCAVTMEPDDVLVMLDKLEEYLNNL